MWVELKSHKGYFVSDEGKFKRVYKNGKVKYYTAFRKNNQPSIMLVKIGGIDINARRVIWETFKGPIPPGYIVRNKNGFQTALDIYGLECVPKINGNIAGGKIRGRQIKNIATGKIYKGTREAAKALHISRQTVSDYCNDKIKKPMYYLQWVKEE